MKKLFTSVVTILMAGSLVFAQGGGSPGVIPANRQGPEGKRVTEVGKSHKGEKKGHRGGKKSKSDAKKPPKGLTAPI